MAMLDGVEVFPEPAMAVSLKDVAKAAGKSPGTVSQVLNNRRANVRISDETRRLILEAADRLGYRPDPIARSLRTRRTNTIGVLVNAMGPNPQQFNTVEQIANARGYHLLMAISRDDVSHEENSIQQLMRRQVDGLLLLSPAIQQGQRKVLERLIAERFPLVGLGPLPVPGGSCVDWDRVGVYREIAAHLLEQGCRRIGFLGQSMSPGVKGRIDGLRDVCASHPGAALEVFGCEEATRGLGVEELTGLLRPAFAERRLDAVVTQTDTLALGVIGAARAAGLTVPRDLAVVGCSNSEFGRLIDVPLTTTSQPDMELAERATEYLIWAVEKPERQSATIETLPAKLLIRQSSRFGSTG